MNPMNSCIAALAVAVIFYIYRGYVHVMEQRHRVLRERVAYMLWVMAGQPERNKPLSVN